MMLKNLTLQTRSKLSYIITHIHTSSQCPRIYYTVESRKYAAPPLFLYASIGQNWGGGAYTRDREFSA
jgi:hypothetical protein